MRWLALAAALASGAAAAQDSVAPEAAPPNDIANLLRGEARLASGDGEGAIAALAPLVEAGGPYRILALPSYARAFGLAGRHERALDAIAATEAEGLLTVDLALVRAEALLALDRKGQALDAYGEALAMDPLHEVVLLGRARLLLTVGDAVAALDDLDAVKELQPSCAVGHRLKAAALRALGRAGEARAAQADAAAEEALAWCGRAER